MSVAVLPSPAAEPETTVAGPEGSLGRREYDRTVPDPMGPAQDPGEVAGSYLHGGFNALLAPQKRPRPQNLSPQRRLGAKWSLSLSASRLCEMFDALWFTHPRAHRDCGPAERAACSRDPEKTAKARTGTAVVARDEFARLSSTCTHYPWAEKNTAQAPPSQEKRLEKLNGFLDLSSGWTTVDFPVQVKTENAVRGIALIVRR